MCLEKPVYIRTKNTIFIVILLYIVKNGEKALFDRTRDN